jgi:transposase
MSDRGYSIDLRQRVMAAVDRGMTQEEAAEVFGVGTASIYRWATARRRTGSLEPKPHGGGRGRAFSDHEERVVKALLDAKPDRTLAELQALVEKRFKRYISASAVVRCLKRLGITRKKRPSARPRGTAPTSRPDTPSS